MYKEGSLEAAILEAVSPEQQAAIAIAKKKKMNEKAVSQQQQKAAGLALAAKRGEIDKDKLTGAAKEMMSMSEKDLEDFASTKHKGLPMKKEEVELEEKYDVKTAKSKMGKITVKSFDSLDDAKAHLEKMKKMGHKGIISQNGKPVNEGSKEEYKKVFDAALKKFNVGSPAEFKNDSLKKKFFDYVDANYKAKDESYVAEAKNDYQIYHNMYSLAVQHAVQQAEKQGYTVDPDAYDRDVALGPKKPSDGKTNRFSLPLLKNGKPQKKMLHMQIYGMGNKYELNMYIEDYNPSLQESDMKSAMKKIVGKDVKATTSGAAGFQKTMYHVSDDMYVTFNDKSKLGDVYYKGKNVDSFRGVGTPDMEKVVKKYMKKYGVKSEESGKTMTGKPWAEIKVESNK